VLIAGSMVAVLLCGHPCAETVRHLDKLRPLRVSTPLVRDGKPAAIVVSPPERKHQALADWLIAQVRKQTGVELQLVDDSKVTDEDLRRSEIVVIGIWQTNKVAERLYLRKWTFEDYVYPGVGGESAGFEELAGEDELPPVWSFASGDSGSHAARVSGQGSRGGTRCALLSGRDSGSRAWAAVSRVVVSPADALLHPGQWYVASVWYRSTGKGSAQLKVAPLKGNMPLQSTSLPLPPHGEWAQAELGFAFPAGADRFSLEVRLSGPGTLQVDDAFVAPPGSDRNLLALSGYVVRTVHDPFAMGHNFVVLAGSDLGGTTEAVEHFVASLKGDEKSLEAPQTVDVRLGAKQRMVPSYGRADPTEETVRRSVAQLQRTIAHMPSLQNNVWYETLSSAEGYHLTGNAGWARLYKAQMELLADNLERFGALPNNYVEGMHRLVPAWDLMEETPFFTDQERLRFTNVVLEVACRNADAWAKLLANPRAEALSSHGGERVQSLRLAGLYFRDHYGINGDWVSLTDQAIRFMDETPRSCDGYRAGCGHGVRMTQYARRSGDMAYFGTESARQQADLVTMCTDNLGYLVSVGDQDDWNVKIDRGWDLARFLGEAAWFYYDPECLWFTQHLGYSDRPFGAFATAEPPPAPARFVGLHALPLHPNLYDNMLLDEKETLRTYEPAPPLTVGKEEAFDKLTFREAADPAKQYLLLDGVSGMDHGHLDGNSISRFTDLGRIWLIDCGWTRVYPRDHNTLLVSRDGVSRAPQKATRLDFAADLDTVAFTKTTIPDYNGADWSRHLIWLKGECVLVLDRVTAKTPGDYALRCRWRSLGDGELREDGLRVTQRGPEFRLRSADGSRKKLRQVYPDDTVRSTLTYPYANRQGTTLIFDSVREQHLDTGERFTFQNVLYASAAEQRRRFDVAQVDDSTVLLTSPEGDAVAGIGERAAAFFADTTRFVLAGATRFGNPTLFLSTAPVDIEFDVAEGKGRVVAKSTALVTLAAGATLGQLDGRALTGRLANGLLTIEVGPGSHALGFPPSREAARRLTEFVRSFRAQSSLATPPAEPAAEGEPRLRTVWEYHLPNDSLTPGGPDPRQTANEILDMKLMDLTGDDVPEIVVASKDGAVTVLTLAGEKLWRRTGLDQAFAVAVAHFRPSVAAPADATSLAPLPPSALESRPTATGAPPIALPPLWVASKDSGYVIVGTAASPFLYVYDADGERVLEGWLRFNPTGDEFGGLASPVRWLGTADLNGDGSEEILAANFSEPTPKGGRVEGRYYCYDQSGKLLWWRQPVFHELGAGTVAPLKPGANPLWFVAGTFGACAGLDAAGKDSFRAGASHRPTVIRVADVDGDGANEVLLGGEDNYLHVHSADGARRWMHNLGGALSGIEVTDLDGDGKREAIVSTAEVGYNVFALNAEGTRLWQTKAGEEVNALAVGDFSPAPGREVAVGTDAGEVVLLDARGKGLGRIALSGYVAKIAPCPGAEAGGHDVIVALKNGWLARVAAPQPTP